MTLSDRLRGKDWTFSGTSRVAQRRNELALYLLIASLGMFFTAAAVGYLLIRLGRRDLPDTHLPPVLWLSTASAVLGSHFLHRALKSVRIERQDLFRPQLAIAFCFGLGFCIAQTVGLSVVLREHYRGMAARPAATAPTEIVVEPVAPPGTRIGGPFPVRNRPVPAGALRLEGLLFTLILVHALHFVAGMVALSIVTWRGLHGRYDHEYHAGVKLCAVYWRFMDVVWIGLFAIFLATT